MKRVYCDFPRCKQEAWKEQLDVCWGYRTSSESSFKKVKYKPFEKPTLEKRDLCKKHFKIWCKVIYEGFFGRVRIRS